MVIIDRHDAGLVIARLCILSMTNAIALQALVRFEERNVLQFEHRANNIYRFFLTRKFNGVGEKVQKHLLIPQLVSVQVF